ncbi:NADH-quinone oxidoreductase subunit K [Roseomonas sp. F4]
MDIIICLTIGVLVAAAAYLLLARDLPRGLLGFVLLGTATNLIIFASGRIGTMTPPLVAADAQGLVATAANPLPQALVLTAIVIGFGLAAFALVLVMRAHAVLGTASAEEMQEAEPPAAAPRTTVPPIAARPEVPPMREVV